MTAVVDLSNTANKTKSKDSLQQRDGKKVLALTILAGQSNVVRQEPTVVPPNGDAVLIYRNGVLEQGLAAANAAGDLGVIWPSYAESYMAIAGHTLALVQSAVGGTGVSAPPIGIEWSPSGTLRSELANKANAAIIAANANYTLGPVELIWLQGETEAEAAVAQAQIEAGLQELFNYFRSSIPQLSKINVIRTGNRNDRSNPADWKRVRDAQENVAASRSDVEVIYRAATGFPSDALDFMYDQPHWTVIGNLAGPAIAYGQLLGADIQPAPQVLSTQTFSDEDDADHSGISATLSVPAGAKALVFFSTLASAAATIIAEGTLLVNGVAARLANSSTTGTAEGLSGAGYARLGIHLINERELDGGFGSRVTVSHFAETATGTAALVDYQAGSFYWLDSEIIQEMSSSERQDGPVDDSKLSLVSGAPALVIAGAMTISAGGSTPTAITCAELVPVQSTTLEGTIRTYAAHSGHRSATDDINQNIAWNYSTPVQVSIAAACVFRAPSPPEYNLLDVDN